MTEQCTCVVAPLGVCLRALRINSPTCCINVPRCVACLGACVAGGQHARGGDTQPGHAVGAWVCSNTRLAVLYPVPRARGFIASADFGGNRGVFLYFWGPATLFKCFGNKATPNSFKVTPAFWHEGESLANRTVRIHCARRLSVPRDTRCFQNHVKTMFTHHVRV